MASAFQLSVAHWRLQLGACASTQLLQFSSLSRCIQKLRMTFSVWKKHTPTVSILSLQLTSSHFSSISSVDCSSWKYKLFFLNKSKSVKIKVFSVTFSVSSVTPFIIAASIHTTKAWKVTNEAVLNKLIENSIGSEILMNASSGKMFPLYFPALVKIVGGMIHTEHHWATWLISPHFVLKRNLLLRWTGHTFDRGGGHLQEVKRSQWGHPFLPLCRVVFHQPSDTAKRHFFYGKICLQQRSVVWRKDVGFHRPLGLKNREHR